MKKVDKWLREVDIMVITKMQILFFFLGSIYFVWMVRLEVGGLGVDGISDQFIMTLMIYTCLSFPLFISGKKQMGKSLVYFLFTLFAVLYYGGLFGSLVQGQTVFQGFYRLEPNNMVYFSLSVAGAVAVVSYFRKWNTSFPTGVMAGFWVMLIWQFIANPYHEFTMRITYTLGYKGTEGALNGWFVLIIVGVMFSRFGKLQKVPYFYGKTQAKVSPSSGGGGGGMKTPVTSKPAPIVKEKDIVSRIDRVKKRSKDELKW